MIVKIQQAFNNNNILVYDKTKKFIWEGPNSVITELLDGASKMYFKARITKKRQIELLGVVKDQSW